MKYWDGQPVRFVCCERKTQQVPGTHAGNDCSEDPWGRMFWCVQIELAKGEDGDEDFLEGDIADEKFYDALSGERDLVDDTD